MINRLGIKAYTLYIKQVVIKPKISGKPPFYCWIAKPEILCLNSVNFRRRPFRDPIADAVL